MSDWNKFQDIDFSDEKIYSYHIDTRDFHCISHEKQPDNKIDFDTLSKYKERFFHNSDEVKLLITRFFTESKGESEWRFFTLKSENNHVNNWNMKYIRIYRHELGLIICNKDNRALSKEILSCPVNTDLLH